MDTVYPTLVKYLVPGTLAFGTRREEMKQSKREKAVEEKLQHERKNEGEGGVGGACNLSWSMCRGVRFHACVYAGREQWQIAVGLAGCR